MPRKRNPRRKSNNKFTTKDLHQSSISNGSNSNVFEESTDTKYQVLLDGIDGLKRMHTEAKRKIINKFLNISKAALPFINTPVNTYQEFLDVWMDENEVTSSDMTNKTESSFEKSEISNAVRKRRSRSVNNSTQSVTSSSRRRSKSIDYSNLKTPKNNNIAYRLLTAKKCTVIKKRKTQNNSCVQVQRVLKPNEEAISHSGSPLCTLHPTITKPEVCIPLPGGLVVRINADQDSDNVPAIPVGPAIFDQIQAIQANLTKLITK